jgi:hypothetical protein
MMIDYEDSPDSAVSRLLLLGVDRGAIRARFTYVRPDGPLIDRQGRIAVRTIERIEAAGGRVIAVAENFDEATPEGKLARTVFLGFAQMQLDRYRDSFDRSKRRALEAGIYGAPRVPIGYTCTRRRDGGTGKLEIDPITADIVREAFEARASGKSWRQVAEILGRDLAGAKRIVENRIYLGELRVGDLPPNPEAHPPLVSRETWEAAQISHPRPPRSPDAKPALLGGLIRCAACSRGMSVTGRPRAYRCRKLHGQVRCPEPAYINAEKVETLVEQAVIAQIGDIRAEAVSRPEALEAAKEALMVAERELSDFTTAVQVSAIGVDAFAEGMRQRNDAVELARTKLGELQAASAVDETRSLADDWPDLSVEEKRHLLRASIGAVWIRRGRGNYADRVKICDPLPTQVGRGADAPLEPVAWNELPISVPIPSSQDS